MLWVATSWGWGAGLENPIATGCGAATNEELIGEQVGAAYAVVVGAAIVMVGAAYEGAA